MIRGPTPLLCLLFCLWAAGPFLGLAQEEDGGTTSAEATTAPGKGAAADQYYNFKAGPVLFRLDGSGSVAYNDNINLSQNQRLSDIIVTPELNVKSIYPVTDSNTLEMDVGFGYEKYIFHPDAGGSGLIITPDSALQFNLYVGDVKINFHDRFSLQRDPLPFGQLSNITSFERFENTAGVLVDWRLGDLIWSSGYDYEDFWVTNASFRYLDHHSDIFTQKLTFVLSPTLQAGISATYTMLDYDDTDGTVENNGNGFEVGPFVAAQITENFAVNAGCGIDYTTYSGGGTNDDQEDLDSWYATLGFSHRINPQMMESLTVGRDALDGITSNFTERNYGKYMLHWNFADKWSASPYLLFENLSDSEAAERENANRLGAGFTIDHQLSEKGAIQFGYDYIVKDSDNADASYYQDQWKVNFQWQF